MLSNVGAGGGAPAVGAPAAAGGGGGAAPAEEKAEEKKEEEKEESDDDMVSTCLLESYIIFHRLFSGLRSLRLIYGVIRLETDQLCIAGSNFALFLPLVETLLLLV